MNNCRIGVWGGNGNMEGGETLIRNWNVSNWTFAFGQSQGRPRPPQTQPPVEPRRPTPPVDWDKLKNAINWCAQAMFGVALTKFDPTTKGNPGNATFRGPSVTAPGKFTSEGFGIQNRLDFSRAELTAHKGGVPTNGITFFKPSLVDGRTPQYGIYTFDAVLRNASGGIAQRFQAQTNINYTAPDAQVSREGIPAVNRVQIHEMGNSLHLITGRPFEPAVGKDDPDAGQAFEECVFAKY